MITPRTDATEAPSHEPAGAKRAVHGSPPAAARPHLGLVCITVGPEVRYRTITRTRFLALSAADQRAKLDELYRGNVQTLFCAVDFCHANGIHLYRVTSALFPQIDHPIGKQALEASRPAMAGFASYAEKKGVRVVLHPDQYVVLNSDSEAVRKQSRAIMADHALVFDALHLPQSSWSCMILHGGKGGRSDMLVRVIAELPHAIRNRLVLENDESAFSAAEILDVCRRAGVPMIFDAHHHVIHEKLESYEHDSVRFFTEQARQTWPDPAWQIVHISNGQGAFTDPKHSDRITLFPSAFLSVPWVEVEAKAKEQAIHALSRQLHPPVTRRQPPS